jgi:pyruvate dehydrogenase (quinone)
MAKQNVAEQFVDILVKAGVKRLYGVVGDSLNPVVDAVRRNSAIDWVHVRHEETAAFAAGAEAQITGNLAACAGSCGPGNLHLINGLYDAHRSMAPVLALASHIPSSEIGLGYFQETHPDRLFQECSHYSEMISSPQQMPRLLQTAIQNAVGRSGVSVVTLPGDIADQPAPDKAAETALVTSRPSVRPGDAEIDKLVEMIDAADKITLFCGSGTAGAHAEVMEFAEKVKSPVGHALRGKEWIQYDNPYMRYLRMYTTPHADPCVGGPTALPCQRQQHVIRASGESHRGRDSLHRRPRCRVGRRP